jgi:hypothetical protein
LKISLKIEDKNSLRTELVIENPDDALKVLLIQNVFNLFGSNVDLSSILELLNKTGLAYKNLFEKLEQENSDISDNKLDIKEIRNQMIEGLLQQEDQIEANNFKDIDIDPDKIREAMLNHNTSDLNNEDDYHQTGIKIRNGVKVYKLHYECICGYKGNHTVPIVAKTVKCHRCSKEMKVKLAHPDSIISEDGNENLLLKDMFGNLLRAGRFKDTNLWPSS